MAGVRRILEVALRHGASIRAIIETIERAIHEAYRPRGGYTTRELDIAFLVKALGGPKLLYVLQKSYGFPSLTTLRRHQPIPQLRLSLSTPCIDDINSNIDAFLDPSLTPNPTSPSSSTPDHISSSDTSATPKQLPGMTLMLDDIAVEGVARYDSSRDQICGLCREHVHKNKVKLKLDGYDVISDLQVRLASDDEDVKACIASSATVVVIASMWRKDHYAPMSLVVSCSDKTERGPELAPWLRVVVDCWTKHKWGAATHGPIWVIASDGDAAFRLAKSLLCLRQQLDEESDLGKRLHGLTGLNLFTSEDLVVSSSDPKHVEKRKRIIELVNGILKSE